MHFRLKILELLLKVKLIKYYAIGKRFIDDIQRTAYFETNKRPLRTEIINFLLSLKENDTSYLEIGVRNPECNFNHIKASKKYSVDPGNEFKPNPVEFKMTSDVFFEKLSKNEVLSNDIKFDVIFIDGLHVAEQVDKDIVNSFKYIKNNGFIVLHDCNPPTEWYSREEYRHDNTLVPGYWNGTTWKAFLKWRFSPLVNSCCIDSDWGVGILSKNCEIGKNIKPTNSFFEFSLFDDNRKKYLNLIDFEIFKSILLK